MFWYLLACVDLAWLEPSAKLRLSPDMLSFPETALGSSSTLQLSVENQGALTEQVLLELLPPFYAPASAELLPGGNVVPISYRPSSLGEATGILHVLSPTLRLELPLSGQAAEDQDRDGSPDVLDCAPEDPGIYPGAPDPCGDGLDQDCDRLDSLDCDGDGALPPLDCNDSDSSVFPGTSDTDLDAVDDDCDGMTDEAALLGGEILITELRPASPSWFELCSQTERPVDLSGLELRLSGSSLRLPPGQLPARSCVALCEASGCTFQLSLPEIDPAGGSILLIADQLLDQVDWSNWASPGTGSWSLDPSVSTPGANDPAAVWCSSPGTPATPNPSCR